MYIIQDTANPSKQKPCPYFCPRCLQYDTGLYRIEYNSPHQKPRKPDWHTICYIDHHDKPKKQRTLGNQTKSLD